MSVGKTLMSRDVRNDNAAVYGSCVSIALFLYEFSPAELASHVSMSEDGVAATGWRRPASP